MHRCQYNLPRRRRVDYYLKQRRKFQRFSRIGVRHTPSWFTLSVSAPALTSSSNVGSNEMSDSVAWSAEMTHKFMVLLSERAKNSHGTAIKTADYQAMLDGISSVAGRRLNVTQLASRFFRLRKTYQAWRKLLQHTGFRWDHESQSPTYPVKVWQEYVKQNPLAQQFYHKGLPHKELYEIVFEKQSTTGRYAYTSTSQLVETSSYSNPDAVPMDGSDFEPDPDRTTGEKRPNTSGHGRARNRRNRSNRGQSLEDAIFSLTDELVEKRTMGSRASNCSADERERENTNAPSDPFSMSNCIDILTAMQVPTQFYLPVVQYLYENPGWREIFVKLPLEEMAN
ncbi:uncharacterized protein LOC116111207 [Pistacia vera]|uniref:uncharacterized protein LOC116111207 n=1 Tax=Pistacia vera TaxID=55513 RepID=UPI001263CACC|nr:uncharacterized protein LOC116111207 [Pistacia vera]